MKLDTIVTIVKEAGRIVMERYGDEHEVVVKDDKSPVTEADIAVHHYLSDALGETGIPVLSEEGQWRPTDKDKVFWVVDPIDGTKDFIQRTGDFSVMVALVEGGVPVQSAVYVPARDVLYYAKKGEGAIRIEHGERTTLRAGGKNGGIIVRVVVSRNHTGGVADVLRATMQSVVCIPMGSIGLKLAAIAERRADVYVNTYTKLGWWDTAAPQLILEEAGGVMRGVNGEAVHYTGNDFHVSTGIIATCDEEMYTRVYSALKTSKVSS